jgi:GntR family transcriptional regulator
MPFKYHLEQESPPAEGGQHLHTNSFEVLPKPPAKRVSERARLALLEMLGQPEFEPGDQIPAERDLALLWGISRMTLRKAIAQLVSDGVLERRSNLGTYVAQPLVERPMLRASQGGIGQIVARSGAVSGSKLLYFERIAASDKHARQLQQEPGASLLVIKRLRTANGVPFCIETVYLPAAMLPGLVADDLQDGVSLYALLAERYGIHISNSGDWTVRSSIIGAEECLQLGLAPGAATLVYKGIAFDADGRAIELMVSVNHPQRVVFKIANAPQVLTASELD